MDRRKFIGHTVLLSGSSLLLNQGNVSAAIPASPTHYVGIGLGACKAIDYLKKKLPDVAVTKAIGLDFDYETGKFFPGGEQPDNILRPLVNGKSHLVIVYCLGGESNREAMLDFITRLKQTERKFKVIVQFPFSFEGKRRYKVAVDVADQISLITPFRSIHANRNKITNATLKYNFDFLNKLIFQLIKEEIK